MTKEELALEVIDRLKKEYPLADCTLDYDEAWKLLVSVRLAAQCTDARVNVVVQDLYARYPDIAALAAATPEEIEAIVKPCGLGKSKARDISACMKILHEKYHDNVPCDFDALLALPGVGRKSANLIMGDVFGKPAIVTDTHCIRLTNRIGLVDGIKDPKKVEMALWKIIPPEEGNATGIDRSPCGTGTSARVAAEFAMGRLELNEPFVQQSIIETKFTGRIVKELDIGGFKGGIPEITGSAYITAFTDMVFDANDSIQDGFLVD